MLEFYNNDYVRVLFNCRNLLQKMPQFQLWKDIISFCEEKLNKPFIMSIEDISLHYEKSNITPRFSEKPFQLFIFIQSQVQLQDVFLALVNSRLCYEVNCKEIQFCITNANEREIFELFSEFVPKITIVQKESQQKFFEHIQLNSEYDFLYYHTNLQSVDQREYLQYFTMMKYKNCVEKLENYDVVGCNYYSFDDDFIEKPYPFRVPSPIFAGNCFWCSVQYFRKLDLTVRAHYPVERYICNNPFGRFYSFHTSGYDFYMNRSTRMYPRIMYEDHEKYRLNYCQLKKKLHPLMTLFDYLTKDVFRTGEKVFSLCDLGKYSLIETYFPKPIEDEDSKIVITDDLKYTNPEKTVLYIGNANNDTSMVFKENDKYCYLTVKVNDTWIDVSRYSCFCAYSEKELIDTIYKTNDKDYKLKLCKFYLDCFELEKDKLYIQILHQYFSLKGDVILLEQKLEELYCKSEKEEKEIIFSYLQKLYQERKKEMIPKRIFFIHLDERQFQEYNYTCVYRCYKLMSERFEIVIYNDREPENQWWKKLRKDCPNLKVLPISRKHRFEGFPLRHVQYEADVLRLSILYENGGVYMDTDMFLLKPFDKILENSEYELYISRERMESPALINSILIASKGNEFLKLWLTYFNYALRKNIWAYHIRETNLRLLNTKPYLVIKHKIKILEAKHFFPYTWQQHNKIMEINDTTLSDDPECYGIHLFETIKNDVLVKHPYLCPSQNL